jgi:cytochrome c-type biogenesis protein CcmE
MHPVRKQRLIVVIAIVIGASIAIGLMVYALRNSINLFYAPIDIAEGKAPIGKSIRAGGMVLEGSLKRHTDSLKVEFIVTDYKAEVPIVYTGILPDLFSEGEGVVATGMLDENGVFQAEQVLAKHDESYMPPEVQDAIKDSVKPVKD